MAAPRLRYGPDAVAGCRALKKKYIIAPLSNGNVSLLTDMAKNVWPAVGLRILSAELAKHYKPDREAYLSRRWITGSEARRSDDGSGPHSGSLRAAATAFRITGQFIHLHPNERGPSGKADHARRGSSTLCPRISGDLAAQMGA